MNELVKVARYYGMIDSVTQSNVKVMCPFHKDKNPSMLLDFEHNTCYCFGCGVMEDSFGIVKAIEKNADELHAYLKYLRICKDAEEVQVKIKPKLSYGTALAAAKNYYVCLKKDDWRTCRDHEEELQYMLDRGFSREILTKAGMKYNYSRDYTIIFPIRDNGVIKGWVCRTIDPVVAEYRKYLYNEGFRRKLCLCGNYEQGKILYVVEGYLDMLKMRMFGLENTVALLGWKMSDVQEEKIRSVNPPVIVCATDNDEAGKKGYAYMKTRFSNVVRWAFLKGVKDAGEMTKKTFDKMYHETKKRIDTFKSMC